MYYILKCDFHTKTQGDLCVQFIYNGLCVMKVEQNINNETYHYEYEFSYDLFKSYIRVQSFRFCCQIIKISIFIVF